MEQIQIKVSTEILSQRADAAEQKISEVRKRFETIYQVVNNSRNYWEGDANDAHRREYQEYIDEIEESLARFQENVTDLRKIGGIYQEAEGTAAEISSDLPLDVLF